MTRPCTCGENLTADPSKPGGEYYCCMNGFYPSGMPVYYAHTNCLYKGNAFFNDGVRDEWYCTADPGFSQVNSQCMTKN
jgi:hypothetical protein